MTTNRRGRGGLCAELRKVFFERGGEAIRTSDALAAIGITTANRRAYNTGAQALRRLAEKGEVTQLSHGVYCASQSLTPKELRRRLARSPPLFHAITLRGATSVDLSSQPIARDFFQRSNALLADRPPDISGQAAGNKLQWRVTPSSGRTITVATHASGVEATVAATDDPLTPSALKCYGELLAVLTGIPMAGWVVTAIGVNKDLADIGLCGFTEMKVTLGMFANEVVRVYEHEGRGVRVEVHATPSLPLATILQVIAGEPWATETQLQKVEAAARDLAATQQASRRLQTQLVSAISATERKAVKRGLRRLK